MEYTIPDYIANLSYLGIFLWFAVLEQFTPIPEEVSLMSMGYMVGQLGLNVFACAAVSVAGLLTFDNGLFLLSLKSARILHYAQRKFSGPTADKIRERLRRNAALTLFISALIPKLRFIAPAVAAISGVRWKQFFWVNGLATLLYTVCYILLGIFFRRRLAVLEHRFLAISHAVFIAIMIVVTVGISVVMSRILLKKNE